MTMKLEKYGVTLKRLTVDKIELVRRWRNDISISQYMEYREYITPEMQQHWFASINNDNNYFFVIIAENVEIGLINIKDIDYNQKCGEAGIFIWDKEFLNSDWSFRAALLRNEFAFEQLGLDYLIGHILKTNKRSIQYSTACGFRLLPNQENVTNQEYRLTKDNFYKAQKRLQNLLK